MYNVYYFFLYKGRQVSAHAETLLSFSTFGPEVELLSISRYLWKIKNGQMFPFC